MQIKNFLLLIIFVLTTQSLWAQFNPVTNPLVYQVPDMEKVTVQKGIVYKTVHQDTILKFDIYYPPAFDKNKNVPVIIFHNGVGGNEVPNWRIYQDWAKLAAVNGMIAVTHQSQFGKTQKDLEDLFEHLRQHADELKLDKEKIGIWACSANTPSGWSVANDPKNNFIRAMAIYYGVTRPRNRVVNRKDLEILLVRAGLDSDGINMGMEELMSNALKNDAHVEFISYPEGQHAFDGVDDTERSREIILQTIDFFKRNLLGDNSETASPLISNRQLWQLVLNEKKTDEALVQFKAAHNVYSKKPRQFPAFNQLINENNLNGLGYQLLAAGRTDDALKIFTANTEVFPNSANAFDALSDAYEKKGDKINTVHFAKLALEKLERSANLQPQFAQAIRESAQTKINEVENPIPHKRAHHELVYDEANRSVVLISGSTPLNGGQSGKFFNDIWRYSSGRWSKSGSAGDERSGIRLAYDSKRNKLFSYGGFRNNTSMPELRVLEGSQWKVLSDLPEMKAAEAGFVYDSYRDRLIAFGGAGAGKDNNDTWEWDGSSWEKFKGTGPGGRQAFAMVYDVKRKKTVLFGGVGNSPQKRYGDTWEFDGNQWKKVTDIGPGERMAPGYAYDSRRGLLIIFGGIGVSGMLGDTWAWDGKKWKKLSDTGPAPRAMGYMAYDKSRDRVVLFGGRLGWPNDVNDTWEWDGLIWKQVTGK